MPKYRIKDELSKKYFTGYSGIGPMMGGTKKEAKVFDERLGAYDETRGWPQLILWDIEEFNEKAV